jgi:mRNA interferase ChpB
MERGDIYFVDLEPTTGREQRGHRPVILVTPQIFNQLGVQLVAPITNGGSFARHRGFAVVLTGTKTAGVVLCNQVRTIDLSARNGRFVESAPKAIVDDVLARIGTLIA